MRSETLRRIIGVALLASATVLAGCAKPSGAVCAPVASWSVPSFGCAAPVVAVAAPAPEPMAEPEPTPEPEPEPPAAELTGETIELRDTVQFETGSAVLLPASATLLDEVAGILDAHPELLQVAIEGHTDDVGSTSSNLRLSKQRAAAVRTYLIDKGIAKARLTSTGFGEGKPVADNATDDGRFKNRRVEFRVSKRQ